MPLNEGGGTDAAVQRFVQLLDKQGLVHLLDVFLTYETFPQTQASLEEFTDLNQSTVSRRVNELADLGIVEKVGGGSPQQFRLNMEYPAAPELLDVHTQLHNHAQEIQNESEAFGSGEGGPREGSPFVELFRYPTNVSLLAAFLRYPEERLRIGDIHNISGVDYQTADNNLDMLARVRVVREIESPVRDTSSYTLNNDHPAKGGFEEMIEALRDDEPTAPADKEEVSAQTGVNRAESIRMKISESLEGVSDADFKEHVQGEWTSDSKDVRETYHLQRLAAEVGDDADLSPPTEQQSESPCDRYESDNESSPYHSFTRHALNRTRNNGPQQSNTAAA